MKSVSGGRGATPITPSIGAGGILHTQFLFATNTRVSSAPWPVGMFIYKTLKKQLEVKSIFPL